MSLRFRSLVVVGLALAGFEVLVHAVQFTHAPDLLTFTAFVAVAELFEVSRPAGIRSSLGIAPAIAYVLLGNAPLEGTLVYVAGAVVSITARLIVRRPIALTDALRSAAIATGAGAVYTGFASLDTLPSIGPSISPLGIFGTLAFVSVTDTLAKSAMHARRSGMHVGAVIRSSLAPLAILHVTIMSLAGLLGLSYPSQGLLSIFLLLGPIGVTYYAFEHLESAQRLYVQTVGALSQVPELAGYSIPGHAHRVADLTTAVARELGVEADEVDQMEYAALLHEIGLLALPDPSDEQPAASRAEIAAAGAAVAAETRHFARVADMIRNQHAPYRRRGVDRQDGVPLGSQIIKVVCAYDALRNDHVVERNAWEALEQLYLGLTYEYDPSVVQALVRVLERRGEPETGLVYDPTRQRDAERVKDDFFSTVSHELRSPLTPMRGWATLLLEYGDKLPEDHKREALQSILAGTEHLGRLVDDLLLASRITLEGERGLMRGLEPQCTALDEIARRAVAPFRVEHPTRTFDVVVAEPVSALADPRLLGQALGSVLSNAVKFSPDGSPVSVTFERRGDRAAIHVRDHGRGIPAGKHEAIFEKFTRLEDPLRMETSGAGLGLYIVRQLVAAMNGSVTVESPPGGGSTFTIWLPLPASAASVAS